MNERYAPLKLFLGAVIWTANVAQPFVLPNHNPYIPAEYALTLTMVIGLIAGSLIGAGLLPCMFRLKAWWIKHKSLKTPPIT